MDKPVALINMGPCIFRIYATFLIFSVAVPVSAEPYLTRFSVLEIVQVNEADYGPMELTANGRVVPGTRCECSLSINTVVHWREDADVVVLQNSGSNRCPASFQFVLVPREGHAQASDPSTDCGTDIILGVRITHDSVELDIGPFTAPDLSHITLRYNGISMEEIEVPRNDSDSRTAGAGEDVTRWIGSSLYSILDDPTERQRFAGIMPMSALHSLVRTSYFLGSDSPFPRFAEINEGYLIVGHENWWHGAIAIEVATGQPYALIYGEYREGCRDCLEVYGATLENIPEPLRKIARSLTDPAR